MSYSFSSAFPDDHFVAEYIRYASQMTDASHEYHEACALALLAMATPHLVGEFAQYPRGLRTNLYTLLLGPTTSSRKSTAKDLAADFATLVWPGVALASKATPEAFVQELAEHTKRPSVWCIDEFAKMLVQLHKRDFMHGLSGVLLEVYGGGDYTYRRTTKPPVIITAPHLTIVACCTETIFEKLHEDDVLDGLLPRFAVVYPDDKPARKPFYTVNPDLRVAKAALASRLSAISPSRDATGTVVEADRVVGFAPDALRLIDEFAAEQEQKSGAMFRRLAPMALKLAMLSAAGHALVLNPMVVQESDAESAVAVARRWSSGADRFQAQLSEGYHMRLVRRVLKLMWEKGHQNAQVSRRALARRTNLSAEDLTKIGRTLEDRGHIAIERAGQSNNPLIVWRLLDDKEPTA